MKRYSPLLLVGIIAAFFSACSPSFQSSNAFLDSRDGIAYNEINADSAFQKAFLVWVEQPLDHNDPSKGTFRQRVWLSHRSPDAPMVMVTEGYWAPSNYTTELTRMLEANQLIVEHRYFDASVPDSIQWEYLTIEQAARDHHRIVQMFKRFYTGKWVNTGISKGGQTAMIHRAFYPKDVDVTVTYVAPFNMSREDPRLIDFFEKSLDRSTRERIRNFQIELLKRKISLMPLFEHLAREKGWSFSMGMEKAYELCVLEYPFSLLQWCGPIDQIPESGAGNDELFRHFYRAIDFSYFSDNDRDRFGPFFYQAYKELGYYAYLASPLLPYMNCIKSDTVSSDFMVPVKGGVDFIGERPYQIQKRLTRSNPRMIHIVGENDPWSSTSPVFKALSNSYKFVDPNGCHLTRIHTLPDSMQQQAMGLLKKWLLKD